MFKRHHLGDKLTTKSNEYRLLLKIDNLFLRLNMAGVDKEFSTDIQECLDIAQRLTKLETEESREFVGEQLRILNEFLQQKQRDAEARVDKEILEEQKEIQSLKERIEKASSDTEIEGGSEMDLTDYRGMWIELKEQYWKATFDTYIAVTDRTYTVKTILDDLINILKTSFEVCKKKALTSRDEIIFQIRNPGQEKSTVTKENDQTLIDISTHCQRECLPFCLSSAREAIVPEIMQHNNVKKYFLASQPKELLEALRQYLDKCVEFCWVASFQEPEIKLVIQPMKECKNIASEFPELNKVTHAAGKVCVEWPALVQGDKITAHWELHDLAAGRPKPKQTQPESSEQHRVVSVEDASGKEVQDTDDTDRFPMPPVKPSAQTRQTDIQQPQQGNKSSKSTASTGTNKSKKGQNTSNSQAHNPTSGKNNGSPAKNKDTNLNKRNQYQTKPKVNKSLDF